MMGGLKIGARVWERAETMSDQTESVEAAQNLLRQQFSAIYPMWQDRGAGLPHVAFEGDPQRLTFFASPPRQFGPGADRQFELRLSPGGNLELSWRAEGSASSQLRRLTLLEGISSIKLEYFGAMPGRRVAEWTDSWGDNTQLPTLIRMQVIFPPGDRRVWPEMVVRPEITVDAACAFDPISRGCRGRPE